MNNLKSPSPRPVVLRAVRREPASEPEENAKTGLEITCPPETTCPRCHASVDLARAAPLSTRPCPSCGSAVFVPGRLGWFLLHGRVGEGQMGTVYRATDESLGRDVAIKLVRRSEADNPASRERLRREARAAGKLNHPRVAQVYALIFSNGQPYLVMELVSGQDFSQKVEKEGRIDERTALKMALDVAEGLSALNREGLVHGDIKPGNIVLDREGRAKLVDFGLSGMTRTTSNGKLVGTPNYIAPELLRGAADTHRSDIYSLGATLYHLMVGRPPVEGEKTIDVLRALLLGHLIPIHKVAGHLSPLTKKLLVRMLENDPAKRPADTDAVAAALREALDKLDKPGADTAAFALPFVSRRRSGRSAPAAGPRAGRIAARAALGAAAALGAGLLAFREHLSFEALPGQRSGAGDDGAAAFAPGAAAPRAAAGRPAPVLPDAPPASLLSGETAPGPADFTDEAELRWQCVNLGGQSLQGSTLQRSGTLIIQSAGTEMSKGFEAYRFVWSKAFGNYAFSASVQTIADSDPLAVSGLLIKGPEPTRGQGLFFGFLGSGELLLQFRNPQGRPQIVRRSGNPLPFPCALRLTRRGDLFEAACSGDGRAWRPFAAYRLCLPEATTVGFVVSPNRPDTLATAKFADVRLLTPGLAGALPTNAVPGTAASTVRSASRLRKQAKLETVLAGAEELSKDALAKVDTGAGSG